MLCHFQFSQQSFSPPKPHRRIGRFRHKKMKVSPLISAVVLLGFPLATNAFISSSISPISLVRHRNGPLLSLESKRARLTQGSICGRRGALGSPVSPLLMTSSPSSNHVAKSEEPGWMPTKTELKKLLPLGLMFFCILFNYTILRDTKDVSANYTVSFSPGFYHELLN